MILKIIDQVFATIQTDTNASISQIPNLNAPSIFEIHRMALGNNVENLVILMPNEGHHRLQVEEDRFIDNHLSLKMQS